MSPAARLATGEMGCLSEAEEECLEVKLKSRTGKWTSEGCLHPPEI